MKVNVTPLLCLTLLGSLFVTVSADPAQDNPPADAAVASDVVRNPASVEGELRQIYEPRQPRAPFPGLGSFFEPWYDLKARFADDLGLRFGIADTPIYQVATDSLTGEDQASGAIFEILGAWELIDRGGKHPGTLGFRVEDRHRLWTDVAPQFLFAEIGAGVPTAIGYSEFSLTLAELWWEQQIVKDRFSVRVGKMLPFGYYDFFLFKNPKTDFANAAFALNPTIAWPQFGLGVSTEVRPREDIYLVAGIQDANGSPNRAGFDTFFDDKEFFVIGEIGWDPGYLSDGKKNPAAPDYHFTIWHTDEREKAGRPSGWGLGVMGQHPIGNAVPFLRYGYSDGGAALLRHLVMGGVAWTTAFNYKQDTIGLAASWGQPSNRSFDDQFTAELYYKMQLTRRLALTPSVQLMVNPSSNPDTSTLAVFGIRARIDF